ncbi:MAG: hypothetical protein U1F87_14125 [Kiritimatiellia bacterium]
MSWIWFSLLTLATWGLYGVAVHRGQSAFPVAATAGTHARLVVGVAFFAVATVGSLLVLKGGGGLAAFPPRAVFWCALAGAFSALGAVGSRSPSCAAATPRRGHEHRLRRGAGPERLRRPAGFAAAGRGGRRAVGIYRGHPARGAGRRAGRPFRTGSLM